MCYRVTSVLRTRNECNAWLHPGTDTIRSGPRGARLEARYEGEGRHPGTRRPRGRFSPSGAGERLICITRGRFLVHEVGTPFGGVLVGGQDGTGSYEWVP